MYLKHVKGFFDTIKRWPASWTLSTPLLIPGASLLSGWTIFFNILFENSVFLSFSSWFLCVFLLRLSMIAQHKHKEEYCLFYISLAAFINLVPNYIWLKWSSITNYHYWQTYCSWKMAITKIIKLSVPSGMVSLQCTIGSIEFW